jgi:hypothetical protein
MEFKICFPFIIPNLLLVINITEKQFLKPIRNYYFIGVIHGTKIFNEVDDHNTIFNYNN